MASKQRTEGKHARHARVDSSDVRPAVITGSSDRSAKRKQKHSSGIARSIITFLLAFILGLAAITLAAGFAYIQARNIDVSATTPTEIAEDFYNAIYAKATGQEYTSRYATDEASEANTPNYETLPQSSSSSSTSTLSTSSSLMTSSSSAQSSELANDKELPTPLVAEYDGVVIHSLMRASQVTAVMFHQASFDYALVLDTKLPEVNPEEVMKARKVDVPADQPTGNEYMNIQAMHVWRQEVTELDTSIDIGSAAHNDVFAPVDGTVVLVREYDLFDAIKDYEVHIQPTGRPDLDVVTIHIEDVSVKAGDKVKGGVTPIAKVRDIVGEGITDIQLGVFIDANGGNHSHVQVNNANAEGYREKRLKDAYKVKE